MNPPELFDQDPVASPAGHTGRLFAGLNPVQREAVTQVHGPLLVLAGAGSGKTRVITHRIAHLVLECGVPASRIVAMTFTNKAAAEMRERVERLLGSSAAGGWIGTFHSLCVRILRRHGERIGLARGFNIYDTDDQMALIKRILKDEVADSGGTPPRSFLSRISRAKNSMRSPDDLEAQAYTPERKFLAHVYRRYEQALRSASAVDFDDLLLKSIELYRTHADVTADDAGRCEQLLVDEYQDTNRPQYLLVKILSGHHGNVCVVGDEDQSIYRFRGAELRNILEFENDHPGAQTIRLEQNYRSTRVILDAAGAVVANNIGRKGKKLWTENDQGEPIELFRAPDDRSEASWIADRARALEPGAGYDGIAVLYRTNAQSRQFEEAFRREGIPFQLVGAVQFYARKEIKDLLSYLRVAANPSDDVAFRRVLNRPARGIGATTLATLEQVARGLGAPLTRAAAHALEQRLVSARAASNLAGFLSLIESLRARIDDDPVAELLESVVRDVAYEAYLDKAYPGLGAERMENVRSLISAAVEHAEEAEEANLESFLDRSALVSDSDDVGRNPGVTLMTIHCAKGLEFPVVFLAGLEEQLFPHAMASNTDEDLEEERRLCYVAMTRARERLLITQARYRRLQGMLLAKEPSRFIAEIPHALLHEVSAPASFYPIGEPGDYRANRYSGSGSSAARVDTRSTKAPAAPKGPVEQHADGYSIGVDVRHPKFGQGRIVAREGSGKNLKLTIFFSTSGTKKILPAYTRLQLAGRPSRGGAPSGEKRTLI